MVTFLPEQSLHCLLSASFMDDCHGRPSQRFLRHIGVVHVQTRYYGVLMMS